MRSIFEAIHRWTRISEVVSEIMRDICRNLYGFVLSFAVFFVLPLEPPSPKHPCLSVSIRGSLPRIVSKTGACENRSCWLDNGLRRGYSHSRESEPVGKLLRV